jgi:hypothetical protein
MTEPGRRMTDATRIGSRRFSRRRISRPQFRARGRCGRGRAAGARRGPRTALAERTQTAIIVSSSTITAVGTSLNLRLIRGGLIGKVISRYQL